MEDSKRFGLLRKTFDLASWWELGYLQRGLKELGLTGYWQEQDRTGASKPIAAATLK